jgi:hypothetical protein
MKGVVPNLAEFYTSGQQAIIAVPCLFISSDEDRVRSLAKQCVTFCLTVSGLKLDPDGSYRTRLLIIRGLNLITGLSLIRYSLCFDCWRVPALRH